VRLPTFWKARPKAWFVYAESKFRLKHVDTEQEQLDYLLSALPEEILAPVMDVLEDLPEDTPYSTLKERLLKTHTLSNFEKLEQLFKTGQLGAREPCQLLNSHGWSNVRRGRKAVSYSTAGTFKVCLSLETRGHWRPGLTGCGPAVENSSRRLLFLRPKRRVWPPSAARGPLKVGRTRRRNRLASRRSAGRISFGPSFCKKTR
jgi:hypothetical protein